MTSTKQKWRTITTEVAQRPRTIIMARGAEFAAFEIGSMKRICRADGQPISAKSEADCIAQIGA